MEKITVRDFRANLKETTQEIVDGKVFYLNQPENQETRVVLASDKSIERYHQQKEYYDRYYDLLKSWKLHGTNLIPIVKNEEELNRQIDIVAKMVPNRKDATIITHGYRLSLYYLCIIKSLDIGVVMDPTQFIVSDELHTFLKFLDIELAEDTTLQDALLALSLIEFNHIQNGMLDGYSDVVRDYLLAIGQLVNRTLITFRHENTIAALEDALDPMLTWYENHISKVRMQTKRIHGVWVHIPCAKGQWAFQPADGEEEYAIK